MSLVTINLIQNRVWKGDVEVILSHFEFSVLLYLTRNSNRFCPSNLIHERIWDNDVLIWGNDIHNVEVVISRLRKRLEDYHHMIIKSRRFYGYMVESHIVEIIQ